ncbi:enolase, N-terminal domain protein [Vibrio parahaemolyticus VPCR-2010]|uniref:enolase n=1 Tax=Vibrio parahaemolyticus TaxID=670 RepID=UPI00038E7246|nr:enolase, N-terminal domain protein [Vibrio parahaemolyticus VPCR-2010]
MALIKAVTAKKGADSKGNETIIATITLESGRSGSASPPPSFFRGLSEVERNTLVTKSIEAINELFKDKIMSLDSLQQEKIDNELMSADDLDKESVLAKISIFTVSLANAKAAANEKNIPLYEHIASLSKSHIKIRD